MQGETSFSSAQAKASVPCLRLQCFQHFTLYLKGREELVVTVFSGAGATSPRTIAPLFKAIQAGYVIMRRLTQTHTQTHTQREREREPTHTQTHTRTRTRKHAHTRKHVHHESEVLGCRVLSHGAHPYSAGSASPVFYLSLPIACVHCRGPNNQLPPASPASHDADVSNAEVTVFLIGAYAKYNWPYVWVRHDTKPLVQHTHRHTHTHTHELPHSYPCPHEHADS